MSFLPVQLLQKVQMIKLQIRAINDPCICINMYKFRIRVFVVTFIIITKWVSRLLISSVGTSNYTGNNFVKKKKKALVFILLSTSLAPNYGCYMMG